MASIREIPEVAGLDGGVSQARIPPELDVPFTPRVRALVDTAAFRRLNQIRQLGLVALVYPGAVHTRFEHSLGVYRLALLFLRQLSYDRRFAAAVSIGDAQRLIAAALLHDVGHWPFCHPIEDMHLDGVPRHESFAAHFLNSGEVADTLRQSWQIEPEEILSLLGGDAPDASGRIVASLLSGPIDIDKMDYLARDSLHAGVPYGRNFDQGRLIGALCLNAAGDGLAIGEKGKTAAEMMVFARYVMFSEVYWHHSVRAATAMLQRAFFLLYKHLPLAELFRLAEAPLVAELGRAAVDFPPAGQLLDELFGPTRRLYKRVAQYSYIESRETYERLARRGYPWLVACAEEFAGRAAAALGRPVAPHEVLFDAPPVHLEVEFNLDVHFAKDGHYRALGEISPVVEALARRQFDDFVKRVRLFAHPRLAESLRGLANLHALVGAAVDAVERR